VRLACIHHLDPPVLGFARAVLEESGAVVTHHSPYRGDPLPAPADLDGAIVFGAEQSVLDLARDPVMEAEAAWLDAVVARGIPVLGICFGAQLMARALGGSVERLPRRMLTWDPLEPTAAGIDDALLGGLPEGARALQWNEDGFEPPPGAVELLARRGQRGVGFRIGECAWGVQFHPEVDGAVLGSWYAGWPQELAQGGVDEGTARAADARHLPAQAELARTVFGRFVEVMRRDAGGGTRTPTACTTRT